MGRIKLAVGLVADIHSKDTYIPIRVNGVDRDLIFDPDNLQEVPEELFLSRHRSIFWI